MTSQSNAAMAAVAAPISSVRKASKKRKITLKPVMTHQERVSAFLSMLPHTGPCVVIDLNVVRDNYRAFKAVLPEASVFYAIKANPEPELLAMLAEQGSCFDVASTVEVDMALAAGASPNRVSFGNTIKKERDIEYAYGRGIRLFAVDCVEEVEKVARAAPGSKVYCRILCDGAGAEWPLSRKFGCEPEMAVDVLMAARDAGLVPHGVSFHPGSQQCNMGVWDKALASVATIFSKLEDNGINLQLINMGGGFPARYLKDVPTVSAYANAIRTGIAKHFGNRKLDLIIEPGRGLVGDAGIIRTEVVLISRKSHDDATRWVYLDLGKFGGLAETMDESIRYKLTTPRDADTMSDCIIAGPTCDSADVLYEKKKYPMPDTLQVGDFVWIHSTGAYTTTYSAVGFNGFAPLAAYCIEAD